MPWFPFSPHPVSPPAQESKANEGCSILIITVHPNTTALEALSFRISRVQREGISAMHAEYDRLCVR